MQFKLNKNVMVRQQIWQVMLSFWEKPFSIITIVCM